MEKERNTVVLAALTLLVYGMVSFLGHGPFAFFPINEVVFAGIALYFSFMYFKSAKTGYGLIVAFALLSLLNSQLLLGFFMDYADSQAFHENPLVKTLKPVAYVFLLIEISRFCYLVKGRLAYGLGSVILISMIAGVWYNIHLFLTSGLLLFAVLIHLTYKKRPEVKDLYPKPLFYLWLLLAFLKNTTLLTIYLYDLMIDV